MSAWLLLRGLTRESGHWGEFPLILSSAFPEARIVTLELPGSGALFRERSPTHIADILERCREQLREQEITGPVYLLALSLGAMIATAWAFRHPDEIAGIVLINTSFRGISPFFRRLRPSSYATLLRLLTTRDARLREATILGLTSRRAPQDVLRKWVALRHEHPVTPANALRQLLAAARFKAPTEAPPIPTLILSSEADALVHPNCSENLARRWKAHHFKHPTAGHDLPLDDGAWVVERVRQWCSLQTD